MGLFNGRDPGAAVTYVGTRPGMSGAVERPHGLRVAPGEHGVIVARHEALFGSTRYDVRFGSTVVKGIPAGDLTTDSWGSAIPALADRPGSFAGAVDRMLVEDPLVGCLANFLVRAVGGVLVLIYALAGVRWLGGEAWLWRYGTDLTGDTARLWVGVAVLLGPVAIVCLLRSFVFPRVPTAVVGLVLAVAAWLSWYAAAGVPGSREAVIVAVVGVLVAGVNLVRLRGNDLHPAWFWYPVSIVFCWAAVRRHRTHPLPGWDEPGVVVDILITFALIGAALYLSSVAVHQSAVGSPAARRVFGGIEWAYAVALPVAVLTVVALTLPSFIHGVPWFGVGGEVLMLPFLLLIGSAPFLAGVWLGWRPLLIALRHRGVDDARWSWVRTCGYYVTPALMAIFRYRA
ncbi:hypothetical protein [Actinokineospora enzanensis]|uniref:hypothetical protein n=1 Tax=Actinokineospora enzanensis TaxID=155975 RepID=UPI00035E034E|nr:hypothetical protein [Actinokineospora enzanensis]